MLARRCAPLSKEEEAVGRVRPDMKRLKTQSLMISILLLIVPTSSFGQQRNRILACKNKTFAAFKPLPELTYECPPDVTNEYDDRLLKSPERLKAINDLMRELESFTQPDWWESAVADLNVCGLRGKPGARSVEEREQFKSVEYQAGLMGNNRIRLVLTPDPCYQTHFNGADAFLLYRNRGKVYVTQVLDGYYSRLENSVSLKLLRVNSQRLIELETVNISGMRPETYSYYFVIDKATNKAVPVKLSRRGKRWTLTRLRGRGA
jgi:hypothetical protein